MIGNELTALQEEVKKQGYTWKAGTTPLAALSEEEQKAYLGLTVDEAELEATEKAIAAETMLYAFRAPIAAPSSVDWRNKGGDWTTAVKDQSSCGSCVAFAVAATIEARLNIRCNNANLDKDLSEAHLFYCGCGNCCGTGWNFAPALDYCKNTGIALESAFPYTPNNQPCPTNVSSHLKLTAWNQVLTVADRKNYLATNGPMVGGMRVYADFYNYQSGVYKHTNGAFRGLHAICIVGYDDTQQCWICKNSWGQSWGQQGWFKIGYGECNIDTSFAFYGVDLNCPEIDPCRRYISYLVRVLKSAQVNPGLRACLLQYACGTKPRPEPIPPQPVPPGPQPPRPYSYDPYEYRPYPWPRPYYPSCTVTQRLVARRVRAILIRCPKLRKPFCLALLRR